MKKTRMEKGITIVALIITVVILLILASVAISSIQNDGILSHAQNVADKYNQAMKKEESMLDEYLSFLGGGEEWITIFEGDVTTKGGLTSLENVNLFEYGANNDGVKYRITVASDEYTGEVKTKPILMSSEDGMYMYALFAVANGSVIGFESYEDAEAKMGNIEGNVTIAIGIWYEEIEFCGIMLEGATCEYTINKIESNKYTAQPEWTTIYEGNTVSTDGAVAVGETDLFEYGANNEDVIYRITMNIEGSTVKVRTKPVLLESGTIYALFGVYGGLGVPMGIGFESLEDVNAKSEKFGEEMVACVGGIDAGECLVVFMSASIEFTLTKIESTGYEEREISSFERYFFGSGGIGGRDINEIFDQSTLLFLDDEKTLEIDESKEYAYVGVGEFDGDFSYNIKEHNYNVVAKSGNKYYGIKTDSDIIVSVELLYEIKGREGTTVAYDSNGDGTPEDWIIYTDRDGIVEIISKNAIGNLTLGYEDTRVTVTTDLDGDGTVGDEEDIAIASYNNAITTINNYCKEIVTSEDDSKIRSVGGTNNEFEEYAYWEGITSVAGTDYEYRQDLIKMFCMGIIDVSDDYWFASRKTNSNGSGSFLKIRYVDFVSNMSADALVVYGTEGETVIDPSSPSFKLRTRIRCSPSYNQPNRNLIN